MSISGHHHIDQLNQYANVESMNLIKFDVISVGGETCTLSNYSISSDFI